MFEYLGRIVSRRPLPIAVAWIVIGIAAHLSAPEASSVAQQGEFAFLPDDAPSRAAEELYRQAFHPPGEEADENVRQDILGSNVVIVAQREDLPRGLTKKDFQFLSAVIRPGVAAISATTPRGFAAGNQSAYVRQFVRRIVREVNQSEASFSQERLEAVIARHSASGIEGTRLLPRSERIGSDVWTFEAPGVGPLLISKDGRSTLIVVQVQTEFLDRAHMLLLERIEAFVNDITQHRADYPPDLRIPANLDLAISGSATVGRDMLKAERQSTQNTELATKVLVIFLLLAIYRAPLLVVIPLVTVGLTTDLTVNLLRHMAIAGWIDIFSGLEIYVTVVVYGAGVDFCLFLISRYKEELDRGATFDEAITGALSRVGLALATSAGTSIAGIGMMMFAQFGKFPQAGFAISFGLFIVLCCALTLTPALLHITRRWAFWPDVRKEQISPQEGWIPASGGLLSRKTEWSRRLWDAITALIERRPATVFLGTVALMLPFAVAGVFNYSRLSYGLLSELRPTVTSVVGAKAVQKHFPAGTTGITTILLKNERFDFTGRSGVTAGENLADAITTRLMQREAELGLADVRSQKHPLGTSKSDDIPRSVFVRGAARKFAHREYVSTQGPLAGKVMRIDLVFDSDPFSREMISRLSHTEDAVHDALRQIAADAQRTGGRDADLYRSLPEETEVHLLGSTASLRDLKSVTDRDRILIAVLVTTAVYLVLITLLGRPAISLYLIVTVVFSYLVTLGVTHAVFWLWSGEEYAGVDWKAPIFVFTILVAMGEDYNVLLMTRVEEEQRRYGPVRGVLEALTRTGGIISSCGIIMAGTFASLMTGTLMGIIQLGFALSFGVLLDTFVVRPILVPSYLVLLYRGAFGRWSRWLGAGETPPGEEPAEMPAPGAEGQGRSAEPARSDTSGQHARR